MARQPPPFPWNDDGSSTKWRWIIGILAVFLAVTVVCVRIVITRAQPILRARVIETLSARFKSRVELAELHVWVADGVHVDGKGLRIYGATDPNPWEPGVQPLIEIGEFRFQTAAAQPVSRAHACGHRLRGRSHRKYSFEANHVRRLRTCGSATER